MNNFAYRKHKGEYPSSWNELSKEQLLFVSSVLQMKVQRVYAETIILMQFTKIPKKDFFKIKAVQLHDMARTIDFIFDKKELTTNHFPKIQFKKISLYGPDDACFDLSFEQFFGYSEIYFKKFAESGSCQELNNLITSLYVKDNETFNPDDFADNLKLLSKINNNKKFAILLFYLGCRDLMANKFPDLFNSKKTSSKKSDFHYLELIDNLNNENIVNNNTIKKSNIYESFVRLSAMIKQAEEIKKQK